MPQFRPVRALCPRLQVARQAQEAECQGLGRWRRHPGCLHGLVAAEKMIAVPLAAFPSRRPGSQKQQRQAAAQARLYAGFGQPLLFSVLTRCGDGNCSNDGGGHGACAMSEVCNKAPAIKPSQASNKAQSSPAPTTSSAQDRSLTWALNPAR